MLLVKLLMMTTSDNDAEALIAVRKANEVLRRAGVNWEEFLADRPDPAAKRPKAAPRKPAAKAKPKPEPTPEPKPTEGARFFYDTREIHRALDDAFARNKGNTSARAFLHKIKDQFRQYGHLTVKQYEAVRRMA